MCFSANLPSFYTNLSISREFGNAARKKQSNFEAEESSFTTNVFVITQNQLVMAMVVIVPMKNQALRNNARN